MTESWGIFGKSRVKRRTFYTDAERIGWPRGGREVGDTLGRFLCRSTAVERPPDRQIFFGVIYASSPHYEEEGRASGNIV